MNINPLKTNRKLLILLCVCPPAKSISKWKRFGCALFTIVIIASNLCGLIASSSFFIKFVSSDLEMSLHALLQMCACTSAIYMHIIGIISNNRINDIFENLNKIYVEGKNWSKFWYKKNYFISCVTFY